MRHVLSEALSVGAVLNWGPGYYHQRQYFDARENRLSTASTLLRYDLEVSGFPSSHCGHLVLLRLRDQGLPRHAADRRLAVDGICRSCNGRRRKGRSPVSRIRASRLRLTAPSSRITEMPPFDSIGANEYISWT